MRSYLNLPHNFELDGFFRAIGKLRASNLPGYQELDMRIGWQASDRLEFSVMGRELLHGQGQAFTMPKPGGRKAFEVVGIPLPFVSYGGTAMVTMGLALGMLMSIARSRRLMQS